MTVAEVSERLGFKPGYIYELARAHRLKSVRQGKYLRFTESALAEFIAHNESSGLDCRLDITPSRGREARTAKTKPPRAGMHPSGAGPASRRRPDDREPMGAGGRADP